jgi:hypothetical protein
MSRSGMDTCHITGGVDSIVQPPDDIYTILALELSASRKKEFIIRNPLCTD